MATQFGADIDRLMRERARQSGRVLRRILAERSLSQYRLALRANLAPETVNRIVRCHRAPTETQAFRLGAALIMTASQRSAMSQLLELCEFDPLGQEDEAVEEHHDEQRRLLPGRRPE